ncbi:hypothetical protein AUR64_17980 [Haloprofundus marisrubri]|uniref:Uncharacterized protein n=1 Tax=Haloprofundus marisrubri TaxID=1514971 RepID=A0A0W1R559_9EURY|nr:DUF5820 family protein [Haloprofundus marisrubri]KTG08565.1 hypothetical protein AUR64_17980 [Haloprofundus marisrubri]
MSFDALPEGWTVWNDEPEGRAILAYRPDVFDSQQFPAPCMPTVFVSNGSRKRRPGASQIETDTWHVTLLLEPEIEGETNTYDSREAAVDGAVDAARRFDDGEVDYRSLYQVPREEYFEKLDELTGRDDGSETTTDDGN